MKMKFCAGLAVGLAMVGLSGVASALTFTDTIDFAGNTTLLGTTYKEITNDFTYTYNCTG
jgi:hypothetical protein